MPTAQDLLEPYLAGGYERENGDLDLHCPIHGDKRRSAVVNFRTKEWYCNSCEDGGSLSGLVARRAEWLPPPNGSVGPTKKGRTLPLPDSARLDGWQSALIGNEGALEYLETKRGISMETIQRFGLGWDGKRYAMPVYDEAGVLRNIRCYSPVLESKIINWPGHGSPPRLYPLNVLLADPKTVVLCEGELDALLANQQGIPTVTGTGGVKSTGKWRGDWSEWFRDKVVYVCFDSDRDGNINARRVVAKLKRFTKKISIIELPFPMGSGKDLTDFILEGGNYPKLRKLGKTPAAAKRAAPRYHRTEYEDLRKGSSIEKHLEVEATLSSLFRTQMSLPMKLKADCNMDWDPKRCSICPMNALNGKMVHNVERDHNLHMDIMGIGKSEERDRRFKRVMNIPQNCSMVTVGTENMTAWDSEIRNGSNLQEQSFPTLIFTDGEPPDINHLYKFDGMPFVSPQGGRTIFIAHKFESARQDLDNFEPDQDSADLAREWIGKFEGNPDEQIEAIAKRFETHVTMIYGQRFLHMAMDIVYHSILNFKFGRKLVGRGWMEALAVGDTRSGKSTTAQNLQELYGYGQLRSGENTTVAGLLGGVEKRAGLTRDGAWAVTAGELPLCDRRLLVIDEAQGLDVSHIGQMSDVRSRGIVEIQKIRTMKVDARVRLIWLGNGRKPNYKFGVDALSDQMGAPEDLARVDIPLYVSGDIGVEELAKTRLHSRSLPQEEIDVIQWIVLWAWSRRPDQVHFSQNAEEAVHDLSMSLADEFAAVKIPILPTLEARIRLARMAVAVAARLFSSPDGHTLSVKGSHVLGAYELYRKFFSDPRLGIINIKEDETAVATASGEHSEDLKTLLRMAGSEVVHKMAIGEFKNIYHGAMSENEATIAQLLIWRAAYYSGPNLMVHRWAQDIAVELEKELFG